MGYVAARAAALGTPSPETVVAVFHGFAPRLIHRALPDAWGLAPSARVLAARRELAIDVLSPIVGSVDHLADALVEVVDGLDLAGRPLAAAHAALTVGDDPVERLWWAATVLREYRGDTHVACLTAAGLGGLTANVLAVGCGLVTPRQREVRWWTVEEWAAVCDALVERGWLLPGDPATPVATARGRHERARLEDATDAACLAGAGSALLALVDPLIDVAHRIARAGAVPYPNPTGVPAP